MAQFIFEIPVTVKNDDGSPIIIGMGFYYELKTSLTIKLEAETLKEASQALESSLQKIAQKTIY